MSPQNTFTRLGARYSAVDDNDDSINTNQADIGRLSIPMAARGLSASRARSGSSSYSIPRKPLHSCESSESENTDLADGVSVSGTLSSTAYKHESHNDNPVQHGQRRRFHRGKQFGQLLGVALIRFIITSLFAVSLCYVVWLYAQKPILNTNDKHVFNTVTTALSMLLGIALASGFKQFAKDTRWWILSNRGRTLKEVSQILQMDSQTASLKISVKGLLCGKLKQGTLPLLWIVINLATQAIVASLGFTWSLDAGIVTSPTSQGKVKVTDLSGFTPAEPSASQQASWSDAQQLANTVAAHNFGALASTYNKTKTNEPNPLKAQVPPNTLYDGSWGDYFQGPDYTQYIFQQWMQSDSSSPTRVYSNRSVYSNATCTKYSVTKLDTKTNTIYYRDGASVLNRKQNLTILDADSPGSTFLTQADPKCYGKFANDQRCTAVCVWEWGYRENIQQNLGFFYDCQIHLSQVNNAQHPAHNISDAVARMATNAVALPGYLYRYYLQQVYPDSSMFGQYTNGNTTEIQNKLQTFAIGVLVGADRAQNYFDEEIEADVPTVGLVLNIIHRTNLIIMIVAILGTQLIVCLFGVCLASRVVVIDEGYFSIARLLATSLKDIPGGSLLDDAELCEAVVPQPENLRYVFRRTGCPSGTYTIAFEEAMETTRPFPNGWYD